MSTGSKPIIFPNHRNFFLKPDHWGTRRVSDIIAVLESAINVFYSHLEVKEIPTKPVVIGNVRESGEIIETPIIYRTDVQDVILLNTCDRSWAQYAYQFSRELCHHIVNKRDNANDRFGWLEETFCELASISVIKKMGNAWKIASPYKSWTTFSKSLTEYSENIVQDEKCKITVTFDEWIAANLEALYKDSVNRTNNKIVALQLFPLFDKNPTLWKCLPYYKNVNYNDTITLVEFIQEWKKQLPENLKKRFESIETILSKHLNESAS